MKNILFIVDTKGWAYDDAATHWKTLLSKEYNCDILYLDEYPVLGGTNKLNRLIKELQNAVITNNYSDIKNLIIDKDMFFAKNPSEINPVFNHKKYDGIYIFYHRAICDSRLYATPVPFDKLAIAINNEKWMEKGALETYETYFKDCKVLAYCNDFIFEKFKELHPNLLKVSQSIDTKVFNVSRERLISDRAGKAFIVGWSGNWNNEEKNFQSIRQACTEAGVKFRYEKDLTREDLNKWYNEIDCIVCASRSEGGPLLILEAGACRVPVITTPVGLAREIIIDKKTGLIANNYDEMVSGIKLLSNDRQLRAQIAKNLYVEVKNNWTYKSRLCEIKKVLNSLTDK